VFGVNSVADDSDDTARLLAAAHGRTVPTTATEMAGAVASMLRPASKAIFVHPYVAAERPRPRDTVSLDRAQDEQREPPVRRRTDRLRAARRHRDRPGRGNASRVTILHNWQREAPCDVPESA
jgi:hypothetical protein